MAPSHYLNWTKFHLPSVNPPWNSPESNFMESAQATILYNEFEN